MKSESLKEQIKFLESYVYAQAADSEMEKKQDDPHD